MTYQSHMTSYLDLNDSKAIANCIEGVMEHLGLAMEITRSLKYVFDFHNLI